MKKVIATGAFDRKKIDILGGPTFLNILRFVAPLIVTNLLQVLYGAADMIIVGLSGVDGAIGAIGTTGAFINLIVNIFIGFSVGANVVVARNIGEGDREATQNSVHTSLMLSAVSGVLCAVIGFTVSAPVLSAMGDEGHILSLAVLYTRVYFLGTPFVALTNFLIAIMRAKGDTKTPFYILTVTGLLNVCLNLLFVLGFGLSVDGVAIATAISNACSAALLAYKLAKTDDWCKLSLKKLCFKKKPLLDVLYNGIPAGVQGALFSLSSMLIQSSIIGINNALCPNGSDVIDGNAAAASIEGFAYTATNAVSQAAVTFTSQHTGAKKFRRIGVVMRDCYLVTGTISMLAAAVIIIFRIPLIHLYVSSELAVATAQKHLFIMVSPYILLASMETGSGILRGLGKSVTSAVVTLIGSCLLRIVWLQTIVVAFPMLEIIYLSYPVTWGITALAHFILSLYVRKRLMNKYESAQPILQV